MIIDILHQLSNMHREIYKVSLEKKEAIVQNDVQRVGEIVKTEWEILGQISDMEEKRLSVVRQIMNTGSKEDVHGPTLDDICKMTSPKEAGELESAAEELRLLVDEQKKINAENQALIGLHLDYMNYMTNVFLKEPQTSNIYGNSGEVEDEGLDNRGIIDSSV